MASSILRFRKKPGRRIKSLDPPAQGSKDSSYLAVEYLASIISTVTSAANKIWDSNPNKHPRLNWETIKDNDDTGTTAKDKQTALCDAIVEKTNAIHSACLKVPKTAKPPIDEIRKLEDTTRERLLDPVKKALESPDSPLNMAEYSSMFYTFLDEVLAEVKRWQD